MKTLDEILSNYTFNCLDGRDMYRIWEFIPWDIIKNYPNFLENIEEEYRNEEDWNKLFNKKEYTRENIIEQLREDVEYGFEKALNRRGLSASLMFEVVRMWNWILDEDEELANWSLDNYAMYGLPLFKATALKYGFPNEIGDDNGDESYYGEDVEEFNMYYDD